jgi:DNA polymerase I-like protein with 3'-5' exonuclease and polymerase domains
MPFLGAVKKTFYSYGESSDFVALDGRRIYIPSSHLSLSTGLQSFEAIVMKWVMREYHRRFNHWFAQRNMVHDEYQIEVVKENADELGHLIQDLFAEAGETLGSLCPLTGEYSIGYTWADTH